MYWDQFDDLNDDELDSLQKGKFSTSDARSKHDGLNGKQASKWSQVANAIFRDTGDEVKAIQGANSVINELGSSPSLKVKNKNNGKKKTDK